MPSRRPICAFNDDHDQHEYTIGGFVVPSVTQVLADIAPGWKAGDYYLSLGRANHACYAHLAYGRKFTPAPESVPYVDAWRAWAEGNMVTCHVAEKTVFSPRFMFAGTLDLEAMVPTVEDVPLLIDYKASLTPAVEYQLAAYSLAYAESGGRLLHAGVGVQLNGDGTWKMSELYDLRRARNEWLAMLTTYGVRKKLKVRMET